MLREYYLITKPGIIRGNITIAGAAYIYGSQGLIDVQKFLGMLVGTSLVIASACVFNNVIDRNIDSLMKRTASRAVPSGKISVINALIYGTVIGLIGFGILITFVNLLTFVIGLVGWLSYVILYGWFKRKSIHGTLIGSISGSTPPLAGFGAATNHLDLAAGILFIILSSWQMAHFYSIAIYRLSDYKSASIPVYSAVKGIPKTIQQILFWVLAYVALCILLYVLGYSGIVFTVITGGFGLFWLFWGIAKRNIDPDRWAKSMFGWSLIALLSLAAALSLNPWLP